MAAVLALAAVVPVAAGCGDAGSAAATDAATVTRIIDGDTFDVRIDGRTERIRLLNVDTPEVARRDSRGECLGPEATEFLAKAIPVGSRVTLEYDEERTDRYGRTLAGVTSANGEFVNAALAQAGLAQVVMYDGNDRFLPEVRQAQRSAKKARRGLYAAGGGCAKAK
jgi:micrococcal nuclease